MLIVFQQRRGLGTRYADARLGPESCPLAPVAVFSRRHPRGLPLQGLHPRTRARFSWSKTITALPSAPIFSTQTQGSSAISTISSAKSSARSSRASMYSSRNSLWHAIQRKTVALGACRHRYRWREGFRPLQAGRRSTWRPGRYNRTDGRAWGWSSVMPANTAHQPPFRRQRRRRTPVTTTGF
jgi:hypothetical protein